jgi:hypothetical protein
MVCSLYQPSISYATKFFFTKIKICFSRHLILPKHLKKTIKLEHQVELKQKAAEAQLKDIS